MLVELGEAEPLRQILSDALGIRTDVIKHRTVYLHDNVRIHLDEVDALGSFLEFEAIVDDGCDDAAAHAKIDRLRIVFGLAPDEVESRSYSDLQLAART